LFYWCFFDLFFILEICRGTKKRLVLFGLFCGKAIRPYHIFLLSEAQTELLSRIKIMNSLKGILKKFKFNKIQEKCTEVGLP